MCAHCIQALLLWISLKASTELVDIKGSFETKLTSLWKSPVGVCSMPGLMINLSSWSLVNNVREIFSFLFDVQTHLTLRQPVSVVWKHIRQKNLQTYVFEHFSVFNNIINMNASTESVCRKSHFQNKVNITVKISSDSW